MKKFVVFFLASVGTAGYAADAVVTDQPWSIEISHQKPDRLETDSQSISIPAHDDHQVTFGSFTCYLLSEEQLANPDSSVRPRTISCGEKKSALRISYEIDCKHDSTHTFKFADTDRAKSYELKVSCPQAPVPQGRLAKDEKF